jgi:DNA polymerase-3 subunit beta
MARLSIRRAQSPATYDYTLTTKLVDGRFPDYEKVIPRVSTNLITADREMLRQAFMRASILSNEKFRGVRMVLEPDQITIQANNPEQEEAEEVVAVSYSGQRLEIGFNVSYLQDVLGVLATETVRISVSDANSSALIEGQRRRLGLCRDAHGSSDTSAHAQT